MRSSTGDAMIGAQNNLFLLVGELVRFIDLFAGLGGFHLALRSLGHECVFASEIDPALQDVYEKNFGIRPAGDIRHVSASDIPSHDILCAGFPCQPFSKAGEQAGLADLRLGNLHMELLRIVEHHEPTFLILENVPNFERHNRGLTWARVQEQLTDAGYGLSARILSPHRFGVAQIRERVYIVGRRGAMSPYRWPQPTQGSGGISLKDVLDSSPPEARQISHTVRRCLDVWQEFLWSLPAQEKVPHPLWSMEFGATYPYEETVPISLSLEELRKTRGSFGQSLANARTHQQAMSMLPSHARRPGKTFPQWKRQFIRRNRDFYSSHRRWLDRWIPKISAFPSSFQKLEWNCQGESDRDIFRYVIQLRPSGVRVKRATTAPSLVAMTATQVPIVGWQGRYMTPTECKRLQSMDDLQYLPSLSGKAYEALGNAVNVQVARLVAEALLSVSQAHNSDLAVAG